jgi:type IV pilus assembly protein PilA
VPLLPMRFEAHRLVNLAGWSNTPGTFGRCMRKFTKTKGFSLIELLVVVAIVLILASIAIPNLLRARRAANEASAVASLRAIASGQLTYRHTQGSFTSLASLGAEEIIDDVLASGSKSGYLFSSSAGSTPALEFTADAAPAISSGIAASGTRFFFVNEDQTIRFNKGAAADSTSSPLKD